LIKALFDGHVLDFLADDSEALRVVLDALDDGRLALVYTHVLQDELNAMPAEKAEKWARLEALRSRLAGQHVTTAFMAPGISKIGQARLASWDDMEIIQRLIVGNPKHMEDALLAMTARAENATLITCDRSFRNRAISEGIEAQSPVALIRRLHAGRE
jgi:hypothetical protein